MKPPPHSRRTPQSALDSLPRVLRKADVLLVVPPFHSLAYPSLAVHLLQACGRQAGFAVRVLYANMLLASMIGEEFYSRICRGGDRAFTGERFFARSAFGLPPLGRRTGRMFDADWMVGPNRDWRIEPDSERAEVTLRELRRWEERVGGYVESVAGAIANRGYRIVGCSASFEQTTASVALLNRIKSLRPETVAILGGANCAGEMARGIASLPSEVDFIFSGECEVAFTDFVRAIMAGSKPRDRLIYGKPCRNLDALPTPAYEEFYLQRELLLSRRGSGARQIEIPYESSRGCWWGQKHHCTFCGFNEEGIAFRQKSPDRVLRDLRVLLKASPSRKVGMTDSIMPYTYFKTLLPRLSAEFPGVGVFYEQRASLTLSHLLALKRAGVTSIQPGIESLSSPLLSLMNKGLRARQNLLLLRNAGIVGIDLIWNLLWGFPGDDVEAYKEIVALIPLLHHLQPPAAIGHVSIDRFSPYFCEPARFGISKLKPLAGYYDFLPEGADVGRIAYSFTAEYRCGSHEHVAVISDLWRAVNKWQAAWRQHGGSAREELRLLRNRKSYELVDTRRLWRKKKLYRLDEPDASALLTPRPFAGNDIEAWAVHKKLAVMADGWFVPLATTDPEVLQELTDERDESPRTRLELPVHNNARHAVV
jgi:ribosomal peptide maturation radical SAM protein 1